MNALSIAEVDEPFPPLGGGSGLNPGGAMLRSGVPEYADKGGPDKLNGGPLAQRPARLNRNILALDLGTKTGWAIATRGGQRFCGTESFAPRASWSPGQRGLRFRAWLASMITKHQINGIWYEIVHRHVGTQAAHLYGAYEMLVFMAADQHQLTVDSVGVGTIKKHAAGSGRADKNSVIDAMKAKGWIVDSDNAADAAAIMGWALDREMGLPVVEAAPVKRAKKAVQPQGSLV